MRSNHRISAKSHLLIIMMTVFMTLFLSTTTKDMFVSGIDSTGCKITNGLKYQDGVSVKKASTTEIPSIQPTKR